MLAAAIAPLAAMGGLAARIGTGGLPVTGPAGPSVRQSP